LQYKTGRKSVTKRLTKYIIFNVDFTGVMSCDNVTIVTRQEWGARDSVTINNMTTPVSFVFIHHTAMSYCHNQHDCSQELRIIQNFHMDTRGTSIIIT
jgi:hypothetical protein